MSYETPWRSQGDSNPCFRRERALQSSLHVHARLSSLLNLLVLYKLMPICVTGGLQPSTPIAGTPAGHRRRPIWHAA